MEKEYRGNRLTWQTSFRLTSLELYVLKSCWLTLFVSRSVLPHCVLRLCCDSGEDDGYSWPHDDGDGLALRELIQSDANLVRSSYKIPFQSWPLFAEGERCRILYVTRWPLSAPSFSGQCCLVVGGVVDSTTTIFPFEGRFFLSLSENVNDKAHRILFCLYVHV